MNTNNSPLTSFDYGVLNRGRTVKRVMVTDQISKEPYLVGFVEFKRWFVTLREGNMTHMKMFYNEKNAKKFLRKAIKKFTNQ